MGVDQKEWESSEMRLRPVTFPERFSVIRYE